MGEREMLFELIRYVDQIAGELKDEHPELLKQKWKNVAWLNNAGLTKAYNEYTEKNAPKRLRVWTPRCQPITELPEGSACMISGISPLEMYGCPIKCYDEDGELCVPAFCEEFHMGGD